MLAWYYWRSRDNRIPQAAGMGVHLHKHYSIKHQQLFYAHALEPRMM